jgi:hypothetical protein
LKIHPVEACHQRWGQQRDARNREYLDDLVLVDVDETDGGVHQEVDLVKQKGRVGLSSESMSRKICRASSNCSALTTCALRIMKLTARRVSMTLRRMRPFMSS